MKYEYGVEYPTSGRRPDLPDDVTVRISWKDGNHTVGHTKGVDVTWVDTTTFSIVDERYKPKAEDNSWFERGWLPPVGVECEAYDFSNSQWVKVKTLDATRLCEKAVACVTVGGTGAYGRLVWASDFRPVKTERERAIEAASKIMHEAAQGKINDLSLGALYDAGLLRLPEEK